MKKLLCFIILFIMITGLSACNNKYTITVNDAQKVVVDCPRSAKSGDQVTIKTSYICDGIVVLDVSGIEDLKQISECEYSFIMPSNDVIVAAKIKTSGYYA